MDEVRCNNHAAKPQGVAATSYCCSICGSEFSTVPFRRTGPNVINKNATTNTDVEKIEYVMCSTACSRKLGAGLALHYSRLADEYSEKYKYNGNGCDAGGGGAC